MSEAHLVYQKETSESLTGMSMSASEWQVMRVIWAHPGATSTEVIENLTQDFEWQAATIKTLLGRLKRKGYIQMEKIGPKYHYQALVDEESQQRAEWQKLLGNMCNTKQGELLLALLNQGQLSQSDLMAVIELAQERLKTAPEQLTCTCSRGQCTCGHHGY